MAGSNGSPAQRGGHAPQWPHDSEEQARAVEMERWHQQQSAPRGHQPGQPAYAAPGGGFSGPPAFDVNAGSHGFTHIHQPEPGGQAVRNPFESQDYPDPAQRGHGHAPPQFERFAPPPPSYGREPQSRFDPHGFGGTPHERHAAPPADPRGGFDPYRGAPPFDQRSGYVPQPYPPAHPGQSEARADPQSWDLSHYQPGHIPQDYPASPPGVDPRSQPDWPPQRSGHEAHWQQPPTGQQAWPGMADTGHGFQAYDQAGGGHYHGQHGEPGFDRQGGPHDHEHDYDADEVDAGEETRRGPSTIMIVSMLVGAIVVGGGLAFAYKQFGGGGQDRAKLAEVKRLTTPDKVKPKDPGGRTIEHSDKKFLNRLASDTPADSAQRQSDVDGSAKKVPTIPIIVNKDGSLSPQPASSSGAGDSGVPGLVLDGLGPPPASLPPPQLRTDAGPVPVNNRLPPPPPVVKSVQAQQPPPRVADLPLPKVVNPPPVTATVEGAAAPRKPRAPARDDLLAPQTASTGATTDEGPSGLGSAAAPPRKPVVSTSSSGYVAVLASKKSRQDALNSFADLHSKYPDILGGITPDVREANLGEKGIWYRLIGGPPGSREAARGLCVKLKARGMTDCWPVAY